MSLSPPFHDQRLVSETIRPIELGYYRLKLGEIDRTRDPGIMDYFQTDQMSVGLGWVVV
jgi:hypothetical protein